MKKSYKEYGEKGEKLLPTTQQYGEKTLVELGFEEQITVTEILIGVGRSIILTQMVEMSFQIFGPCNGKIM